MTEQHFRELVAKMRSFQTQYVTSNAPDCLNAAKHYEKRVDEELKRWKKERDEKRQPKLF